MCGIFGAAAPHAAQAVLSGLQKLEYRGYDSWGIAGLVVGNPNQLELEKHVGKISSIKKLTLPTTQLALGHTRWATHGGVTEQNAHPHLATDGSFAVVQNGVVENMLELKEQLLNHGFLFKTETDTEVIVRLIEQKIASQPQPLTFQIFTEAIKQLEGRNSVAVLTTNGEIFALRYGSPLVVGRSGQRSEYYLSSDISSLADIADEYYALPNGEGVQLEAGKWAVFDQAGKPTPVTWERFSETESTQGLGEFKHFMEKEILEQPAALLNMAKHFWQDFEHLQHLISSHPRVWTLGIGSAGFAAEQIAWSLRTAGVMAQGLLANEAESYRELLDQNDLVIAISQSGETADSIEVVEWMQARGVKVISLVNAAHSTLEGMADYGCSLGVGPEIGVASTKALTAQMTWGILLAAALQGKKQAELEAALERYCRELKKWFTDSQTQDQLEKMVKILAQQKHLFILGRGQLLMPAHEAALKMKEIAYLHSEGMSGGELKHGPLALIEPGVTVVCLVATDEEATAQYNACSEIKARGGEVLGVASRNHERFDSFVKVVDSPLFAPISAVVPFQLATYQLALIKGIDPDKPRNLAKSVTVK